MNDRKTKCFGCESHTRRTVAGAAQETTHQDTDHLRFWGSHAGRGLEGNATCSFLKTNTRHFLSPSEQRELKTGWVLRSAGHPASRLEGRQPISRCGTAEGRGLGKEHGAPIRPFGWWLWTLAFKEAINNDRRCQSLLSSSPRSISAVALI